MCLTGGGIVPRNVSRGEARNVQVELPHNVPMTPPPPRDDFELALLGFQNGFRPFSRSPQGWDLSSPSVF